MRVLTRDDFRRNNLGVRILHSYATGMYVCPICEGDASDCPHTENAMYSVCNTVEGALAEIDAATATPDCWFTLYLSGDKQARKQAPIARGLHGYFPNACINVAHVSFVANEQHNPGLPMQWDFDKSTDEADCQIRHALDAAGTPFDDDGLLHLAKKAWRAMAELERYLLETYPGAKPGASVTGLVRK